MPYIIAIIVGLIIGYLVRPLKNKSQVDQEAIRLKYEKEAQQYREELFHQFQEEVSSQREQWFEKMQSQESSIAEQIKTRREQMIKDLNTEIELRKEQNRQLKIELANWIEEEKLNAQIQIEEIQEWIEDWRSKQNAVVESYKKLDELKNKDSHHRILLNDDEEVELIELNKAIRKLKNPLPFRKAVYDIYYKPKINELVLRVIGQRKVSGIYKIIHVDSGRTYVGQSVDIGSRWKQHAKRGSGADVLTANKLYPAMLEFGLESFHFEIVEEIEDTTKLNEAEKYWQNYFKAQEFGYSIK